MSVASRDKIAKRLEQIRKRNDGVLTPEDVVSDAMNKSSPLHDCGFFTWDLEAAAKERWIEQARILIRTVKMEVRTDSKILAVPFYIRDQSREESEQGYTSVAELKNHEDLAIESVQHEFARAVSALNRACEIGEYLGLSGEVRELIKRIEAINKRFDLRPKGKPSGGNRPAVPPPN